MKTIIIMMMIATNTLAVAAFSSRAGNIRFRLANVLLHENKNNSCGGGGGGCGNDKQQNKMPQLPSLVLIGDRDLLTPCQPFDDDNDVSEIIENDTFQRKLEMLKECQRAYGGIGIAACQVGWRERVFCMGIDDDNKAAKVRYPDAPNFTHQFWINPTIKPRENNADTSWFWEGCLSVPGMRGWVERPTTILISGYNERGEYVNEQQLDGIPARVAQHEYDHLDGILFPDRALTGTLLPAAAFDDNRQDNWPIDWPTRGSRNTKPGGFSTEQ